MRPREPSADLNELLAEEKYSALRTQLRPSDDEPLFVPQAGAASKLRLRQFNGGRDAKYIVITRADSALDIDQPLAETIGFARSVQGVEIIYDATAEAMQGKTRPFTCDLKGFESRLYALLPVQIENIAVNVRREKQRLLINCEFLDASGDRMQAALPFETMVISASGNLEARFFGCADAAQGIAENKLILPAPNLGRGFQVVVRSLLTDVRGSAVV